MPTLEWISANSNTLAVLVAAISALIAAITAIAAFCSNSQNKKQYQESIQPQLSMSLVEYNSWLYLTIKNTGKLPAKNVRVTLEKIKNNGGFNEFIPDALFSTDFELYPDESVQGKVAMQGADITHQIFPKVYLNVSYQNNITKSAISYSRTVTYQSAYTKKIVADVNMDTRCVESSLGSIARASVRTANYFDGRQVAAFDELNIFANKSLKNDLLAVYGKQEEPIMSREETITGIKKQRRNKNAQQT